MEGQWVVFSRHDGNSLFFKGLRNSLWLASLVWVLRAACPCSAGANHHKYFTSAYVHDAERPTIGLSARNVRSLFGFFLGGI